MLTTWCNGIDKNLLEKKYLLCEVLTFNKTKNKNIMRKIKLQLCFKNKNQINLEKKKINN